MATQTELTDLFEYGIDVKSRRIYFGHMSAEPDSVTDFTPASIELAIRALHKMALEAPGKPIELHMNSYGGDAYAMLRLHDEILSCPCQVKFYGGGAIMSSATWIMVACDERYLHPHATVMVHDGQDDVGGKHTDSQITATEMKRLQGVLYDIYTSNTRMPREFWEDVCQRDVYLTANEAITLGMADKIVESKKRGNLRKVRQAALKKTPDVKELQKLLGEIYSRINRVKVPKLELNTISKEPADPAVVVDTASPETSTVEMKQDEALLVK
jgi:ATP-dependent Clp protease protease subunit